jgi:hypothetical protein
MMTEAVYTCETSVSLYETTRRNIPEDSHFHGGYHIAHNETVCFLLFS